jgi:hypothetical protein
VNGYEVKTGDEWRRRIVGGLSGTDWPPGLLSKHSVRDPGVCLDELSIALHVRGGTILMVLGEAETKADFLVSVSHI